jgi:shikimate kinase
MNIVLIGYRGTGKSVVGELLAARLRMQCIGMDAEIVKRAGMSIPEIVEKHGWQKFRDIESEEARE